MRRCGVYLITCRTTGHRYIGSAEDVDERWAAHKRELRRGRHANKALQYAWGLFGETSFEMTLLEETSPNDLAQREDFFIVSLAPEFNAKRKAGGRSPGREEKVAKCLRLPVSVIEYLHAYSKQTGMTLSDIVEESIREYCKTNGIRPSPKYLLKATKDSYVLLKQDGSNSDIVDQQVRNGVSLETIKENYESKFDSPVDLVVDEGA